MSTEETGKITVLLKAWRAGDGAALDRMIPMVYEALGRLASRALQRASDDRIFQTTALVHEAYLRLVDVGDVDWKDRVHFFAVCAQIMRRILIDAVRADRAAKRGGGVSLVEIPAGLDGVPSSKSAGIEDLLAVDEALSKLAAMDPRRARIVELRVFAGLDVEETAEALALSEATIKRDWKLAKAWLLREFQRT